MTLNKESKRLFIGGLPYKTTEGELLAHFVKFGKIVSLRVVKNRWGKSRGIGYIEFDELQSAVAAKNEMHNFHIDMDRTIIVDFAQPDPFETEEGKRRHFEAQESKPMFKRKYLDEFGNRNFAVKRESSPQQPRANQGQPRYESNKTFTVTRDNYAPQSRGYSRPNRFESTDRRFEAQAGGPNLHPDRPTFHPSDRPRASRFEPNKRFESTNRPQSGNRFEARDSAFTPSPFAQSKPFEKKRFKGGKPVFNSIGRSINKTQEEEYRPKFAVPNTSKSKFKPKKGQKPEYKASDPFHVRSSVFKQKKFGSKVGAKFAQKTKSRQK